MKIDISLIWNELKKKDSLAVLFLFLAVLFTFYDLFTLKMAFLSGDHREQQYPWALFYQQQIRQFQLPWWTTEIQSGFPLLAEGQIGAFYPFNFLFLFFLPIKLAYNYEIIFHYFLGALLFYIYLRRSSLSIGAAIFASLIYLFGSTQGGYFYYNLISQRVVIWLPLTLILIDRIYARRSFYDAFWLSLVFTLQIFAGYLQVAIYSIFYSSLYFLYFWFFKPQPRTLFLFLSAVLLGFFFSLVQLLPILELALMSSRAGAGEGLAYVGSMNPLGWITLFYPAWDGFLKSEFYISLLGIFFFLLACMSRKTPKEKFFIGAVIVFILLALGKFSPLYRLIVELTHFQGFRTPIKFLFFVSFSCAILAAYGFDQFKDQKGRDLSAKIFVIGSGAMAVIPLIGTWVLNRSREALIPRLQHYVETHVYGKAGHPHSLEFYKEKVIGFYEGVSRTLLLSNPFTFIEWILIFMAIGLICGLLRCNAERKLWKFLCIGFVFFDLFIYGFTSIRPNLEPYSSIGPNASEPAMVKILKSDPDRFRVMELYSQPSDNERFPFVPNANMIWGIEDIGAYSPLVMRNYKNFFKGWGYVNDSIEMNLVNLDIFYSHLRELSLLNVKYILSLQPLKDPALIPKGEKNGVILYQNKNVLPRAFFVPGVSEIDSLDEIRGEVPISMTDYHSTKIWVRHETNMPGLLVLTDVFYPNWKVIINGKEHKIQKVAHLFRGVPLEAGRYEIVFEYAPTLYRFLGFMALGLGLCILSFLGVHTYFQKWMVAL